MTPIPAAAVANVGTSVLPNGTAIAVFVSVAVRVALGADVTDGVGVCVSK